MKNTFEININNNNKMTLTTEGRIDLPKYKLLRSNGFIYSNSNKNYIYNGKLENAIITLKDMQNNKIVNNYSLRRELSEEEIKEHKKELAESTYNYSSEEVKTTLENIYKNYLEKKEIQKKEKELKEAKEQENRNTRGNDLINKIKTLKNGFTSNLYNLALANYRMSELLTSRGVCRHIFLKEELKNFGLEEMADFVEDSDVLELSIRYRSSYYTNEKILTFKVNHFTAKENSSFMSGGSNHYSSGIELFKTNRINFKDVVTLSGLITDELIKNIIIHFISYKTGSIGYKSGINALGMISEHITSNNHLEGLKQAF